MYSSSKKMLLSCIVASTLVAMAAAVNEYLPPSKGYNYDRPSVPFPDTRPPNPPSPPSRPSQPPQRPPSKPAYVPPPSGPSHEEEHHHHEDHHHHEPGMPFDFSYNVNENGNDYSHNAISDGDVTQGEYRVALPDGRTQIVKYTADWKNGFNAEVSYEGEASYPDQGQGYGSGPASGGGYQY